MTRRLGDLARRILQTDTGTDDLQHLRDGVGERHAGAFRTADDDDELAAHPVGGPRCKLRQRPAHGLLVELGQLTRDGCGAVGAEGVISVASNLYVREIGKMVKLARANDFTGAAKLHRKLYPAFKTLFIEPNPVPIKAALVRAGIIASGEVRGPLCDMTPENAKLLERVLAKLD